jgi:hypothetical protein
MPATGIPLAIGSVIARPFSGPELTNLSLRMSASGRSRVARDVLLCAVLFLTCFGLGYQTLNRYDPRTTGGLSDTNDYYQLVTAGPAGIPSHVRYRVLVPYLARFIYSISVGHTGTWDPVFFGLLVVNAFFTASTAYLIVLIGRELDIGRAIALLAAAAYLLNFETVNLRLSGLIDSAEGCFLLAIVWCLTSRRVWVLPGVGVLGGLAKESFAPFCIAFTAAWWLYSRRHDRWRRWQTLSIFSTGIAALLAIGVVQCVVSGSLIWPWSFGASMRAPSDHLKALRGNIIDRNLLYVFVWLLPAGLPRLDSFPRSWIVATAVTTLVALFLVAYYAAPPGAAARSTFSIAGPLLCLSAATLVAGSCRQRRSAALR